MPPEFIQGLADGTKYLGPNIGDAMGRQRQDQQFQQTQKFAKERAGKEDEARKQARTDEADRFNQTFGLQQQQLAMTAKQGEAQESRLGAEQAFNREKETQRQLDEIISRSEAREDRQAGLGLQRQQLGLQTEEVGLRRTEAEETRKFRTGLEATRKIERDEDIALKRHESALADLRALKSHAVVAQIGKEADIEKLMVQMEAQQKLQTAAGISEALTLVNTQLGLDEEAADEAVMRILSGSIVMKRFDEMFGKAANANPSITPKVLEQIEGIEKMASQAMHSAPTQAEGLKKATAIIESEYMKLIDSIKGGGGGLSKVLGGGGAARVPSRDELKEMLAAARGQPAGVGGLDKAKKAHAKSEKDIVATGYADFVGKVPDSVIESIDSLGEDWKRRKALEYLRRYVSGGLFKMSHVGSLKEMGVDTTGL